MEDYRWGIFLAEADPDRKVNFGDRKGEPAWQEVPGEHRSDLRRLIVVQGDTEPASVEQQRHLGMTAPSLYDMRNLFQVNVEEGRHLWAMVYLLQAYFGKDGREEAEQLLKRNSGDFDSPRILGAFNEETTDWLSFFMFTYFTDRDGKYQLGTLKESGFDPLARTCEFMLKEEAHHMFVGTTGVQRTVQRTAELMKEHGTDDIWQYGGIPLSVIQKYLNFQFSVSMDLFGSETSSNVASYYTSGLKGRWMETRRKDDHQLHDLTMDVPIIENGAMSTQDRADAHRAQPRPAQRVRRRLRQRRQALEPGAGGRRPGGAAVPAAPGLQPQGRLVRRATTSRPPARSSTTPPGRRRSATTCRRPTTAPGSPS